MRQIDAFSPASMRASALVLPLAMALAGCGDSLSESEQAALDQQAVEAVRRANDAPPPLEEVVPDPILYPDIETHDLFGQACAYAPGTSLGARVIAREADAYMKIDGDMIRFAADPGSRELPARSRSLYNGREYSLRLSIDGEGQPVEGESEVDAGVGANTGAGGNGERFYEGTIFLRDRWNRVIYQGSGTVSCSG